MFDDLIIERDPPDKRHSKCDAAMERYLPEAAVMLAYAEHLLRTLPGVTTVEIHPDGVHGKQFEIAAWLLTHGFSRRDEQLGITLYRGTYVRGQQTVVVDPRPGLGDVTASTEALTVLAECKGGIVNTSHAGQTSRLRKGLLEAIGQLMQKPKGGRQVAVVPNTKTTLRLATAMAARAHDAGIYIALVDAQGQVTDI
ncbi:MAG TPA: hypothetical protein VGM18_21630 [Candidatus Sulfotelmatobacter sp.]|jgi:hypothetical protein